MTFTCNLTKWQEETMPDSFTRRGVCKQNPYYTPELLDLLAGFRDSIDPMMQAQMGLCGTPIYLSGTGASTANYCMIQILEDTIFNVSGSPAATLEQDGSSNDVSLSAWSGKTFKAGMFLYGNFTKITLVSGFVKCYPHPFL